MALIDQLNNVNAILTLMERVKNLAGAGIISLEMYQVMNQMGQAYLETIFPPPPPEE